VPGGSTRDARDYSFKTAERPIFDFLVAEWVIAARRKFRMGDKIKSRYAVIGN
jgi:hypothetical protein